MAKCCDMFTLRFTIFKLKNSNFCERVRKYKRDLLEFLILRVDKFYNTEIFHYSFLLTM